MGKNLSNDMQKANATTDLTFSSLHREFQDNKKVYDIVYYQLYS